MKYNNWTKAELQTYILLLCANADSVETEEEIHVIKSKTDSNIFEKIYQEFKKDNENERFEKIDKNIHHLEYSNQELTNLEKKCMKSFLQTKNLC